MKGVANVSKGKWWMLLTLIIAISAKEIIILILEAIAKLPPGLIYP